MKNRLLFESALERVFSKLLSEESSINNEVIGITNSIINEFNTNIKDRERQYIKEGIYKSKFVKDIEIWGYKVMVDISYIHFRNRNIFEREKDNIKHSTSIITFPGRNRSFIIITTYGVSGNVKLNDLSDSLQHEFNHLFQASKGSTTITNTSFKSLYNIVNNNLKSNNELLSKIAWSLYYSYDFEQDGFINGAYSFFMQDEKYPNWEEMRELPLYNAILTLRNNLKYLKNREISREEDSLIKSAFNINYNYAIKFCERGLKRFVRKIYNVLRKIQKDKDIKVIGIVNAPLLL